jgi:hypothetical protein
MIDKSKTYRTRDGREVRIYATDGAHNMCVHGAYRDAKFGLCSLFWSQEGEANVLDHIGRKTHLDLIEVRPRHKRTVWLNVYGSGIVPEVCSSKERADLNAGCNRIACIKVDLDFEEGEGL